MKSIRSISIALLLTLGLLFLLQACSTSSTSTQTTPSPTTAQAAENTLADSNTATGPVHEIAISAFQYGFDPSTITLKKGERVKLTLTSKDVAHAIAIPDLGVTTDSVENGESTTVEFTPTKTGTFPFKCSVFCGSGHKEMKGTVIVTE